MEVNIISNCCAGATLYKNYLGIPYNNPFIWAVLYPKTVFTLLESFYTINWLNIKLEEANLMVDPSQGHRNYKIIIDNKVEIFYIHYQFNEAQSTIYDTGVDVFYNRIWEYVIEKYISRVKRMGELKVPPSFLLCDNKEGYSFSNNDILRLLSPRPFKIVLATDKDLSHYDIPANVMVIHHDGDKHLEICDKYHADIIKFITTP